MSPKIRYFITADYATTDEKTRKLSVNGFFDAFRNVLFPSESNKFFVVIGIYNVEGKAELILRFKDPDENVYFEHEVEVSAKIKSDTVNNIFEMDGMPLSKRGVYTVEIFDKNDMSLIQEFSFIADFPSQRVFKEGEIEAILKDPTLTKGAQIKLDCPNCNESHQFDLNLDPARKIREGFKRFPEDNILRCGCGSEEVDLTGLRRQIEWSFGQKLPNQ